MVEAEALQRLASQSDIALACVPFLDRAVPPSAVSAGRPDIAFLIVSAPEPATWKGVREAVDLLRPTPVIIAFPETSRAGDRADAFAAGASETIDLDASPIELSHRVRNVVQAREYRDFNQNAIVNYEGEIRGAIGEILLREYEELFVLGKASEFKDQETGAHVVRVAHYSRLIARMIGQSEEAQDTVFHASALHDIGKLSTPDAILLKPGFLSDEETSIMRLHTTNGYRILEASRSSYLLTGALIALTHHERYDGSGYPMGIGGEEIPLFGRIVGIADVFDALTSRRPYKDPWTVEAALAHLVEERGKKFDPTLVDAFVYNEVHVRAILDANDSS